MEEGPKLYVNKSKKAQMKQVKGVDAQSSSSAAAVISSYYSSGTSSNGGGVSKPPEVPKESFAKRYKYIWPFLLTVNLAIGAYFFMRTKKKDGGIEGHSNATPAPDMTTSVTPSTSVSITENLPVAPVAQPARVSEPIPEQQQRELFKWILEEKRKIKTNDPVEKKRIDEEKAVLKQFIRAKSIPSF